MNDYNATKDRPDWAKEIKKPSKLKSIIDDINDLYKSSKETYFKFIKLKTKIFTEGEVKE